ncbi:MAG: Gfo/Idh/MocA family protein [Nocardioidaceae bacterium]
MSRRGGDVRWGVLGTANIAAHAFLPALREAGGRAVAVGSRDLSKAAEWAQQHQVERAGTYQQVVDADDVDAVYVALPNHLHVQWAAAAVSAGKAVLCEKPLGLDTGQVRSLLADVSGDTLLWEAFVFPFHPQTDRLLELVRGGDIGDLREMVSEFHFQVKQPSNIRLQPSLGGGALYDVGCYPIRLARLLTGGEPGSAVSSAHFGDVEVDLDMAAVVQFPDEVRLLLSAGLRRPPSTYTRIVGTSGELRVSNPFHPRSSDSIELWTDGSRQRTWSGEGGSAFEHAVAHINAVVHQDAAPRLLARGGSLQQAAAVDLVRAAMQTSVDR